jgi:hypothetical protein
MIQREAIPSPDVLGRRTPPKLEPKPFRAVRRFGAFLLQSERRLVTGILIVGLVHGLIYLFLEPPWEHYEEPSHFEYAWLISHNGRLPKFPAFDQAERRQIAGSMIAHGFFARRPLSLPDLNSTDQPIWIGINTTGAMPLYHLLVALPLRLAAGAGVDAQLYVARLVSLALFVLTIALAYLLMTELVPPGHGLRWAVPLSLALMPGFVDLMTAVNNDVGATFMFSLFLWATVRLVIRGFTLARLLGVLILCILCVLTKNTLFMSVPLVLVPVGMALWLQVAARKRNWPASLVLRRALLWGLVGLPPLALALGLGLSLNWGEPALWYRRPAQSTPVRVAARPSAPGLGNLALGFTRMPGQPDVGGIEQVVPYDRVLALRGQTLTLGAWMWATQPVRVIGPTLVYGQPFSLTAVTVGTQPAFFAWPVSIAADARAAWILVEPALGNDSAQPVTVYYDGIVLTSDLRPVNVPPVFSDSNATQGSWGGQPFVNEVRNGSVEQAWPTMWPWAERLVTKVAPYYMSPSILLGALLDWRLASSLYLSTAVRLFRTFWGSFAWGNVELAPIWYILLRYGTLLGMAVAVLRLLPVFGSLGRPRQLAIIWLGVALLAIWTEVLLRGLFTVLDVRVYIPTARYAYPVIIPTMLLLVAGWSYWPWRSGRLTGLLVKLGPVLFCAAFLVLDVQSVLTIIAYYSR